MKIGITMHKDRTFNGSPSTSVYVESSEFDTPDECLAEISQTVRAIDIKAYIVFNKIVNNVIGGANEGHAREIDNEIATEEITENVNFKALLAAAEQSADEPRMAALTAKRDAQRAVTNARRKWIHVGGVP